MNDGPLLPAHDSSGLSQGTPAPIFPYRSPSGSAPASPATAPTKDGRLIAAGVMSLLTAGGLGLIAAIALAFGRAGSGDPLATGALLVLGLGYGVVCLVWLLPAVAGLRGLRWGRIALLTVNLAAATVWTILTTTLLIRTDIGLALMAWFWPPAGLAYMSRPWR